MKTKLLLFICLLMAVVSSKAQDENLKMKFDFNNVSGTIPISETLGIEGIESSSNNHAASPVYDLSGKQVKGTQLPRNGIFIQKGKKFVGR